MSPGTDLDDMVRPFVSQDLSTGNHYIILVTCYVGTRFVNITGLGQCRKVIDRGEDVQTGTAGFAKECDLTAISES